ncbi:MAG TPA: GDSL-type esterase/lipase family protein [Cyclobacteriaceae bacterium]|nr:GDSL-type esterase/lipase family protein [Cyclobacteriaceae bacterium]
MRLLVVLCFIALNCQAQDWDTIPVLPDHYNNKLEAFKKQKASTGKILFLGNSITEMGDFKTLLKDTTVVNRGIGGDITFGVIARIEEVTRFKPSKLFLLIGVNDLSKRIPENVILNNIFSIVSLIHAQSPKTKVYVQSILPVNPTVQKFPKGYDVGENARLINGQLANLTKRLNYTFVDMHKFFTDVEGNMDAKYTYDGLHLNAAGYALWMKILKDGKHL